MNNQIYIPNQEYKVLCLCKTYNQSKYIEDTLNGFAMQKTDFPFVCLVIDDCSTDGEQEVIKAWLERECDMTKAEYIDTELATIVLVPNRINPTCSFAVYFLKRNLFKERALKESLINPWREHCIYEAMCEGDDYWIAPTKLQCQFNAMQSDSTVSLCYTRNLFLAHGTLRTHMRSINCTDFRSFLLYDETITLTAFYPTKLYLQYIREVDPLSKNWLMGDTPLWLYLAQKGRIFPIDKLTAIYNAHEGSASRLGSLERQMQFNKSALEIRLYFIESYKDCEDLIDTMYSEYYRSNLITSYYYGRFVSLVKNYIKIKNKEFSDFLFLVKFWPRKIIK